MGLFTVLLSEVEAHFTLTLNFAPPMRQILNPNALSDAVDGKLGAEICEGFKRLYKLKDLIEIKIA